MSARVGVRGIAERTGRLAERRQILKQLSRRTVAGLMSLSDVLWRSPLKQTMCGYACVDGMLSRSKQDVHVQQ